MRIKKEIDFELIRKAGKMTGEQLREIRLSLGLNQTEFAEVCGYSNGQCKISEMENNKRSISGTLVELCYFIVKTLELEQKAKKESSGTIKTPENRAKPA